MIFQAIATTVIILPNFLLALGLVFLVGRFTRTVRSSIRVPLLVIVSCLLITPSWGPATIAVVPVAFGWLLVPTLFAGTWPELLDWVSDYARWHAVAFPVTAVVSYLVVRRFVRPNNSFKPKPLRDSS